MFNLILFNFIIEFWYFLKTKKKNKININHYFLFYNFKKKNTIKVYKKKLFSKKNVNF